MNELNKTYTIKAGDLLPSIEIEALDRDGLPIDLTGYTAHIKIAPSVKGRPIVDSNAVLIVSAAAGTMRYDWAEGETDKAGEYLLEIILTDGNGKESTIPGAGYANVIITPRL